MWFCKNSGQQSIKSSYLHIGVLNCLQLSIVDINWMAGSVFGGISYNVSTIFAKSREKSHRLWTKNLSLARGLLALQIKIPLGIHFLGPWEGGKRFYFFFLSLWLHPLATLTYTKSFSFICTEIWHSKVRGFLEFLEFLKWRRCLMSWRTWWRWSGPRSSARSYSPPATWTQPSPTTHPAIHPNLHLTRAVTKEFTFNPSYEKCCKNGKFYVFLDVFFKSFFGPFWA